MDATEAWTPLTFGATNAHRIRHKPRFIPTGCEGSNEGEVMADLDDGGSAFPVPSPCFDHIEHGELTGMTVRDYFAAAALKGMLAYSHCDRDGNWTNNSSHATVACEAYRYAEAMINARKGN